MQSRSEEDIRQYIAYNPQLEIDGKEITYFHSQPIRFLGKLIFKDLKDDNIREMVKMKLDGSNVTNNWENQSDWNHVDVAIQQCNCAKMTWEFTIDV